MKIKAILFDKDGTLIDVNRTWIPVYRDMLAAEFALDLTGVNEKLALAGYDIAADVFQSGSVLAGGTTDQLVRIWWPDWAPAEQQVMAKRIDSEYAPLARKYISPLLDLPPLLSELMEAGYHLGVGTNDAESSARNQMAHLGVAQFFKSIIGYDSVQKPKPSGQMIEAFARSLGIRVEEVAMVGDNTHDLEEAEHGGAGLAIGVLSGNGTHGDLSPLADIVISSVAELPKTLRDL
jgi:phosphoglycolate phosphatase